MNFSIITVLQSKKDGKRDLEKQVRKLNEHNNWNEGKITVFKFKANYELELKKLSSEN